MLIRRSFLKNLSAGAATLAGVGTLDSCASAQAQTPSQGPSPMATRPVPRPGAGSKWDFSWLDKVTKPHRMAFDHNTTDQDMVFGQAEGWMDGAKDWYGVGDDQLNAVIVLRHVAAEIAVTDEMRQRVGPKVTGTMTLESMVQRGAIVLACNRALTGLGSMLAKKENVAEDEGQRLIRAALRPGVYLVPNGVFGVALAQEAGCGFFRVG
jgi:hypothetical protein